MPVFALPLCTTFPRIVRLMTDAASARQARHASVDSCSWAARLTGSTALVADVVLTEGPRRGAIDSVVTTRCTEPSAGSASAVIASALGRWTRRARGDAGGTVLIAATPVGAGVVRATRLSGSAALDASVVRPADVRRIVALPAEA